jgi:Protein of unknown function (DUF3147)
VTPRVAVEGLKRTKAWEYLLRFAFGGLVTACAALVTQAWGPAVGGVLLGFPAILPASLTLVKEHDGRAQALDDARGGRLGSAGLLAFAAVLWQTAQVLPMAAALAIASVGWIGVGVVLWGIFHGGDRDR